ncbi:hypothetical protein [Priestia sp. P5]|uniref:hypothetical protein n=1 Tax=Priestia sp. P5 TaxID=2917806 RepID=UPI0024072C52|nr:hypothetical protein [Priestia sp. P5]MDG0062105.1 hypothetical protein [Priestia sp. P5]
MIDYSRVMKPTKNIEISEEERKKIEKIKAEKKEAEVEELVFKKYGYHPLPDQVKDQVVEIEKARQQQSKVSHNWNYDRQYAFNGITRMPLPYEHCQPVYILDKDFNIIARVEAKNLVRRWLIRNEDIWITDKTVYRYLTSGKLFRGQYYFVSVNTYEEFISEKKNKSF